MRLHAAGHGRAHNGHLLSCVPGLEVSVSNPTMQETVFGVADGATYSGMLCLAEGGRYYFAQAQVDGHQLPLPKDNWPTRDDAVRALAEIAAGSRRPL